MGHKRVFNIITSQCINGQWGIADIAFSITSKEKALWQMDTINRLTQRGEWFAGSECLLMLVATRIGVYALT